MSIPLVIDSTSLLELMTQAQSKGGSLRDAAICLVDLRPAEAFSDGHIPGAVNADAGLLSRSEPPMGGLMPEPDAVNSFLKSIGANLGDQIIAYDAGKGTAAARLIWVLDAYGYEVGSWLSGGFNDWQLQGFEISTDPSVAPQGDLSLSLIGDNVISADALMPLLGGESLKILDVRSENEFAGTDVRAARGGHVPGAYHLEWTSMLDSDGRLLNDDILEAQLEAAQISKNDTVVVYCQTHQRSSLTYVALRNLGFQDVRALDGAWSNWGNRQDTPIE